MQAQMAGLPWFAEDDYASFRTVMPERAWHATYGQWLAAAEQTEKGLQQRGIRTVKAHVRSDAFVEWCRSTCRHIDSKALVDFGNEAALRVYMGEQTH